MSKFNEYLETLAEGAKRVKCNQCGKQLIDHPAAYEDTENETFYLKSGAGPFCKKCYEHWKDIDKKVERENKDYDEEVSEKELSDVEKRQRSLANSVSNEIDEIYNDLADLISNSDLHDATISKIFDLLETFGDKNKLLGSLENK